MPAYLKRIAFGCLCTAALARPAIGHSTSNTDFRVYGIVESFTWEETYQGERVVREEGPRFGIGADIQAPLNPRLILIGLAEFYFGEADYDGGIQSDDGSVTPINSETSYTGLRIKGALGTPLPLTTSTTLVPFGGFGLSTWLRTLDTHLGDSDIGLYGYEEYWATLCGVLGLGVNVALDDSHACFASVEADLPVWNSESVDLSNVGGPDDVELEPGREAGWSASAGFTASRFTASLYAEFMTFGESDVTDEGFLQPESSSDVIGARAGMVF
ncbi:MAG: hypothetical protein K8T26_12775 [Lentisphaerae bacterium]|nr:hypothetical protein [Lentisphaerota bacterium]